MPEPASILAAHCRVGGLGDTWHSCIIRGYRLNSTQCYACCMTQARNIERVYAHFHRVLAELLRALTEEADVTWLTDERHLFTGDHSSNRYSPAIYSVTSLDPYREQLAELESVQAEALELTGRSRPGRNLLPPLQAENVTFVRISSHSGQTGRTIEKEAAIRRLKQLEATTVQNLQQFEQYASRHDPARMTIEAELKELRHASEVLGNAPGLKLRETYQQLVIRPYLYYRDGDSEQLHMRSTGLIAAGPSVRVEWRQGPRRQRSDKIKLAPLASAGPLKFYDLSAWEAARTR